MHKHVTRLLAAAIAAACHTSALAEPAAASVEHISIIGSQQQLDTTAGSVSLIDEAALEAYEFDDIARVLATVPGVNIRQEDGFGLRPNIGFRGVTPERSKKINIMEDGVLIGPAPYSAPAAYYFPMVSKMTAVEVTKGPSTIAYGPNTVAGALNLVTRQVPTEQIAEIDIAGGTDGYYKSHAYYGNAVDKHGFLVEGIAVGSDGFKTLDNGGDTGFEKIDLMAKYKYDLSTAKFDQYIQIKGGYSEETSHETYLGLTDDDFAQDPYRRYAASGRDKMDWEHNQLQLTHFIAGDRFDITTRLYRNNFDRAWNKIDGFESSLGGQIPTLQEILTSPDTDRNAPYYAVLTGQADSSVREKIVLGNNAREYYSQGLQIDATLDLRFAGLSHQVDLGARYHDDEIQRNHTATNYFMRDGALALTGEPTVPTSTNTEQTDAVSVYASDTITLADVLLTAGIRGEFIDGEYQNRAPGREQDFQNKSTRIWLPAVSVFYQVTPKHAVFAGFHQGFVPTSPIQSASIAVEQSDNFEAGWRFIQSDQRVELIGFYNDYSNLIESCSISAGCDTDTTFQAGDVDVYGLEAAYQRQWNLTGGWRIPLNITYTHTQSEFQQTFYSEFAQWGFVEQGASVPYLAENMFSVNIGLVGEKVDVNLLASYSDSMPESAQQTLTGDVRDSTLAGKETDALFNIDLSAGYQLTPAARLYGKITNLLDNEDIVSRRPYGARPNLSRQMQVGVKYAF
ncbi:TonB-dependent receptor family protein [Salinimonas chungwhensis]|uniref:TonB-dependent receptor family protein n=1 Tax=Salinimonas chungwhensis TaxID=265425 RepID=UPI00037ACB3B|nr:TonB-dependent receptor [Salinimonas chungwhensis]